MLLLAFLPGLIVLMVTLSGQSSLRKPWLFFSLALLASYLILIVGGVVLLAGVGVSGATGAGADGARGMLLVGGLLGLSLLPMAPLRHWLRKS